MAVLTVNTARCSFGTDPSTPNWRYCDMQTIRKLAVTRPAIAVTGLVFAALALGAPRKW
jgi:hypothetical protein